MKDLILSSVSRNQVNTLRSLHNQGNTNELDYYIEQSADGILDNDKHPHLRQLVLNTLQELSEGTITLA